MILTLDVGNTNITCGIFDGEELRASFRITTKLPRTSDEYGMMLCNMIEKNELTVSDIKDAIIAVINILTFFIVNLLKTKLRYKTNAFINVLYNKSKSK